MDPIVLSVITAGVVTLARDVGKGVASAAGKSLWETIRGKLGWKVEPADVDLAEQIARKLNEDGRLAREIVTLLQSSEGSGDGGRLVGRIDAEKVIVADTINVQGDFRM